MSVSLHDFLRADRHGDDVAGYLEPGDPPSGTPHRFVHWRSSNPMLPAFVNCLEGGGDMRRIYTDRESAPWVRPRGPGVKRRAVLRPDVGDGALPIDPVPMTTRSWPARVAVPVGPAPLSGGLHAAALSSSPESRTDPADDRGGRDAAGHDRPGPARALGHYALAARTLIAASASSGFAGVHDHVGAILVDDAGAVLAAGINTGSYRHAEVSLLLSWFRDHPRARALPAKCTVFTTLTPCRQCTRYLLLAKASDTLVRFDEADAGRSGRVGERIAERIASGIASGIDPAGDFEACSGVVSGNADTTREAERRAVRNAGEGGRSRIARAREARRTLLDAAMRSREADPRERSAEAAVLAYLARWVRTATIVA